MNKLPKATMNLKQFMVKQEVLKLYREILREVRRVPDANDRQYLKDWAKTDFRNNMHHNDELTIKTMIQQGRKSLKKLQTSLELSK